MRLRVGLLLCLVGSLDCGPRATPKAAPELESTQKARVWHESFESIALPTVAFYPDPVPDDGPFADGGLFFTRQGIHPPKAFRATARFGEGGFLTIESYSRRPNVRLDELVAIVPDPTEPSNHVLRIRSPEHTDATVIRPSEALPARYRVTLRVGLPRFGDGSGKNGYDGGERADPWLPDFDATAQNGFYWLAILDAMPRPHNNVWIHHHRKVVIDSDNHSAPWMEIWNGRQFESSGVHPVMMFALDGRGQGNERVGQPFLAHSAGIWQPSGVVRAVDAYLPGAWYEVSIERDGPRYTLTTKGKFEFGGERTYRATIDAAKACLYHYPVNAAEAQAATGCAHGAGYPGLGPLWPHDSAWPDWFMFGDPHVNFYEGEVLYDDVRLEVLP